MGRQGTLATIVAALLAPAVPAHAEEPPATEPTRATYKAQVEPICKRDTQRSKRILKGAEARIKKQKLVPAGRQFLRVSRTFGGAIGQIVAVPRPPADEARLQKWFKFLRIVKQRLHQLGKFLVRKQRRQATHASIRLERSGNAANNVSFPFHFHACRISRDHFK
jgi:hypothetical protein